MNFRDRIVELRRVKAGELRATKPALPNPRGKAQRRTQEKAAGVRPGG
jgi:hypothetical protein